MYAAGCSSSFKTSGFHTKKKSKRYKEQRPEQVEVYLKAISDIPESQIAYVDETGIDTYLYREYCYSQKGQSVIGYISGRKYRRVGIVAAKMGKTTIAPMYYDGTMKSKLFEKWFEKCLLPKLEMSLCKKVCKSESSMIMIKGGKR